MLEGIDMSKGKRLVDRAIRFVILSGVMLGADVLALVMALCGAGVGPIMGAMGACGVVGLLLAHRTTTPLAGPSPPPGTLRPKRAPKYRQPQT
jgi:hypothetical protein